ncbi:MAG: rod shape-determining protein MreC [Burkholderiaceae bacterium]|nr:rod shape-determining protein MreC [Burkholderiaceae bacterium]
MEYSPPPLFKQGASARLKVIVFALIALLLLAVDSRVRSLGAIRQAVGTALYPLQMAALAPRDAAYAVGDYFSTLSSVQRENDGLRRIHLANAQHLQQRQLLAAENAHLRGLLAAAERVPVKSLMAEILYDTRDPFTRKIVLNRGAQSGVRAGQPVIDEVGVVGQVTRVFPLTAEVTLLTDKAQAIPVQVVRSGVRSVAYGRGQSNALDLRFMPANADIHRGDILVTSGIDGVYPAGLAVASVVQVESQSSDAFARIVCLPLAGVDRNGQLLVLLAEPRLAPPPEIEPPKEKGKSSRKRPVMTSRDSPEEAKAAVNPPPAQAAPPAAAAPAPAPVLPAKPKDAR